MSYCEDYIDPFDREPDDDGRYATADDEGEWECPFPGECVMPGLLHHRSECHTAEDAEAYYKAERRCFPMNTQNKPTETKVEASPRPWQKAYSQRRENFMITSAESAESRVAQAMDEADCDETLKCVNGWPRLIDGLVKIMSGYGEPVSAEIARTLLSELGELQ